MPGPVVLYVFQPHGSKKISDCTWLNDYVPGPGPAPTRTSLDLPSGIFHDQEPLDWNFYCQESLEMNFQNRDPLEIDYSTYSPERLDFEKIKHRYFAKFNLKFVILANNTMMYDRSILIHSEKNSVDLAKYEQAGFVGVHYWAHSVIARDWYRFAQQDHRLQYCSQPQNKFLIYCRDWSHRREYRLKFLELLVQNNLHQHSATSVMHVNSEDVHFTQHRFSNPEFELDRPELISQIKNNNFSSHASAYYDFEDYINSEVSVVLETVFDDGRVHLTEKTLRPIACGHPFILAAGPGSLEYIKSYGFKTFAPLIDESYDQEPNSLKRLEKIIQAMNKIKNLTDQELAELRSIAQYNKQHFFSDEFFNAVKSELKTNLDQAYNTVKHSRGQHYMDVVKLLKSRDKSLLGFIPNRAKKIQLLRQLRQSYQGDQSSPLEDPAP